MSFKEMIKQILNDKKIKIQITAQNKRCQFHIGECHPYYSEVNNMDDTKIINCQSIIEIKNNQKHLKFSHQIQNHKFNINEKVISPDLIILENDKNLKCKIIRYKGKDNIFHNTYKHQKCYKKFIIEKINKYENFIILNLKCENRHEVIRKIIISKNKIYNIINIKN